MRKGLQWKLLTTSLVSVEASSRPFSREASGVYYDGDVSIQKAEETECYYNAVLCNE